MISSNIKGGASLANWAAHWIGSIHEMNAEQCIAYNARELSKPKS
jgi:hypothetical protein